MPRERLRGLLPFAALGIVAAGFEAWLVLSGRIPRSSDQAVVALMARHILAGRGHPVFYWGSAYGGTLESHLLVPVFAVFGASPEAFRAFYLALFAVFLAATAAFTARFFGRRAALAASALLAVPPFFLPYKALTSDGAYASVLLLSLATLGLALLAGERLSEGRRAAGLFAALGLVAGAGLWVTPVTLPVSFVALVWLLAGPGGGLRLLAPRLAAYAAGALAGATPSLVWNARHGWASLTAREMASASGAGFLANLGGFFTDSVPVLLGAGRPNFAVDPHASFPGAPVAVPFLVLLLLGTALLARRRDRRLWLLAAVPAALFAAAVFSARLSPAEPRYLVGAYAALLPLLGISAAGAGTRSGRLLSAAGLAALVATDFSSALHARVNVPDTGDAQVTGPIRPLIDALGALGARDIYASYWTAYRVTFESREEIVATPIAREDGTRWAPWDAEVRAAARPAVVLLPPRDACFRSFLEETGEPFSERATSAFRIFFALPKDVVALVGRAATLPMPKAAYRVAWSGAEIPARLAGLAGATGRVRVTNEGPCVWMHSVRLVASWDGPEAKEQAFPTPDRRVPPGQGADLTFALAAPPTPGAYTLRLDLEQEGVARFSSRGGARYETSVTVTP